MAACIVSYVDAALGGNIEVLLITRSLHSLAGMVPLRVDLEIDSPTWFTNLEDKS